MSTARLAWLRAAPRHGAVRRDAALCDCCADIRGAVSLKPFFTFYGGKWRAARHYPGPQLGTVIEPFAGSAGYAVSHPAADVWLNDSDPVIVGTWEYLIAVPATEILALPDLEPGQAVDDLALPEEARSLIGWWLNKGSAVPKRRPSSFMLHHPKGAPYWGPSVRARIASQLDLIRHWKVTCSSYLDLPDARATWFIDPPYASGGQHYRHGSAGIDYGQLAAWAQARAGQVIVCEADDASWLPFRPLTAIDGNEGRQKGSPARMEVIWTRDADAREGQS